MTNALTPALAARFAGLTLGHIGREYPNKLDHVMAGADDVASPAALHPIFFGSFDWHSCVHGWWQLLRIARRFPELAIAAEINARAAATFVPEKVDVELAYLDRTASAGFERPYGWAWLLALHHEMTFHAAPWANALAPLAEAFAQRFHAFLPKLTYPLRAGTHSNIAFALILAGQWARERDDALNMLIAKRAVEWFGNDHDIQAWEPSGDEFLSPALCEAMLMTRVLDTAAFSSWFSQFLPRINALTPSSLLTPATVSDRSDGKIVHLDGLNLSRAWCWRAIAAALGASHGVAATVRSAADTHIAASLPHVAGDYMGEHWLASFALLAIDGL